jgi:hypothetical protein
MNKDQMMKNVIDELKNVYGYVNNPRQPDLTNSLYHPTQEVLAIVQSVTDKNVIINVYDVVDNGMNWGMGYHKYAGKMTNPALKFEYNKVTLEKFMSVKMKNRISKLKQYHNEAINNK